MILKQYWEILEASNSDCLTHAVEVVHVTCTFQCTFYTGSNDNRHRGKVEIKEESVPSIFRIKALNFKSRWLPGRNGVSKLLLMTSLLGFPASEVCCHYCHLARRPSLTSSLSDCITCYSEVTIWNSVH